MHACIEKNLAQVYHGTDPFAATVSNAQHVLVFCTYLIANSIFWVRDDFSAMVGYVAVVVAVFAIIFGALTFIEQQEAENQSLNLR